MTDFIIKRSGEKVPFDRSKLEKWAEWAANNEVNWQEILDKALIRCPNGVTTKDFHKALIDTCTDTLDFNKVKMAARLLVGQLYKDVFGKFGIPDLKTFYKQMVKDNLWEDMGYSDDELDILNKAINHNKDLTYSYTTVRQTIDKYLIKNKNTKQIFETPQFMFMGVAMMTMKDDTENKVLKVTEWYNYLSDLKYNLPTPIANAWRTPFKSYASCAVLKSDDSADSIEAAQNIAYTMTTAQAGIGGYVDTRSAGDPVANGRVEHTGKLPYYRMFDTSVRSSKQGNRSGAMTMFYPCLDPEVETLLKLKNVKTPLDKRINLIDYGFQCNSFFWKKVAKQESWMLVSRYYAPKLYELFFSSKTDEFEIEYNRVLEDNSIPKQIVKALDIAKSFMVNRQETGRIYPWWADTANKQTPFKETIYSSNLCLHANERVVSSDGYLLAKDLYELDKELVLFDGNKPVKASKMKLRERGADTYKITLDNGIEHTVTSYHKLPVQKDRYTVVEKQCKDLMVGDKLILQTNKGLFGTVDMEDEAFLLGLYQADGTQCGSSIMIDVWENNFDLLEEIQNRYNNIHQKYGANTYEVYNGTGATGKFRSRDPAKFHKASTGHSEVKKVRLTTTVLNKKLDFKKGVVPEWIWKATELTQWQYIRGLFYADGTISNPCIKTGNVQLSLTNIDLSFLKDIQLILANLGATFSIYKARESGYYDLPNGEGDYNKYKCKTAYKLATSSKINILYVDKYINFLSRKNVAVEDKDYTDYRKKCRKIVSIEYAGISDVFCPTVETEEHIFISQGIKTFNCVEIQLPTKGYENSGKLYQASDYSGECAMCNLGAYVLNTEDTEEDIEKIYYYGVKLTDKTISEMKYPLESIAYTANMRRSIGIGLTNLAYIIAKNNLSYSSKKGKEFIHSIAERHSYYLHRASLRLGKELGNAPWINKTKYPDGWFPFEDSSKLLDKLDLDLSLKYDWETLRKEIIENKGIRNSVLDSHMPVESSSQITNSTNGLYPVRELVIVKRSGSNTNIFFAPEYDNPMVRYFYESAYDVPPKDLLECYALVQKHTGQGISADTYIDLSSSDAKMSMKEQIELMIYATQLGLKSLYYMNTRTDADTTEESCESCKM